MFKNISFPPLKYLSQLKIFVQINTYIVAQWIIMPTNDDGWLCFTSHRQRGHLETAPHLLSLAKDVKLGWYTVPTGDGTPGRRMGVHCTTAVPTPAPSNDETMKVTFWFIFFLAYNSFLKVSCIIISSSIFILLNYEFTFGFDIGIKTYHHLNERPRTH